MLARTLPALSMINISRKLLGYETESLISEEAWTLTLVGEYVEFLQ